MSRDLNLTNEWKKDYTFTITVYCPVCQQPKKYIIKLPPKVIDEILYLGFTEGICHWIKETKVIEDSYFGEYDSQQISRGGSVMLYNRHNQERYVLNLEGFLNGFYHAFAKHLVLSMYIDGKEDFLKFTPKASDELIQYALFGDIRYPYIDNGGNCCDD